MSRRSISLLSSLLFVLLLFTPTILADNEHEFQELVRDVPEERLHAALHDYNGAKFQHGVFPGDRPALEVIHRERAADATRLVKLAKRQSNITTTSTGRNTATTATTATTSRPTTTPTTIVSTGSSSTGQSTRQTTSESGSTTAAPSATSKRGTTSLTSRITRTVTGADGGISTITGVTVVVATPTDESTSSPPGEPASSTTGNGTPGLQQNVGLRVSGGDSVIVAVIAALGFFML